MILSKLKPRLWVHEDEEGEKKKKNKEMKNRNRRDKKEVVAGMERAQGQESACLGIHYNFTHFPPLTVNRLSGYHSLSYGDYRKKEEYTSKEATSEW